MIDEKNDYPLSRDLKHLFSFYGVTEETEKNLVLRTSVMTNEFFEEISKQKTSGVDVYVPFVRDSLPRLYFIEACDFRGVRRIVLLLIERNVWNL